MTDPDVLQPRPKPARRKRRWGVVALAVGGLLVALLAVAAAAGWYLLLKPDRDVAPGSPVQIAVRQGTSTAQIAHSLATAGVVNNALMFRIQARLAAKKGVLKAGVYDFVTRMPDDVVIQKLQHGPDVVYFDVPIPEGFTGKQIAARIAKRTGISEEELLNLIESGAPQFAPAHPYLAGAYGDSLEGYLFPATYRIKKGTTATQTVEMMLQKFDAETGGLDLSYARSKGMDLAQVVTLASIIEREVRLAKEYPLVSSVIYNRIAANMRLQLDSTVFYTLPEGTTTLTSADLHSDNPYNTYTHRGLPPGPLSNPGMEALQAAAHPANTKYYYYVLTGKDGSQTFTTNYKDFLAAVKKYHQVFGK